MTNFEKILAQVPLESNAKVVDIGAGGFEGETTTKYLVDRFDWVVAVDKNRDRALKLADKFDKEKLGIIVCTLEDFEPLHPYDLMVIDLDEGQIPWIFGEAISEYGTNIVKMGGYVITLGVGSQTYIFPKGFTTLSYIEKWDGCHLGWYLMQRVI